MNNNNTQPNQNDSISRNMRNLSTTSIPTRNLTNLFDKLILKENQSLNRNPVSKITPLMSNELFSRNSKNHNQNNSQFNPNILSCNIFGNLKANTSTNLNNLIQSNPHPKDEIPIQTNNKVNIFGSEWSKYSFVDKKP